MPPGTAAPEPAAEAEAAAPALAKKSSAPTIDAETKPPKAGAMSVTINPGTPASARKAAAKTKEKGPTSAPEAPAKPKGKIASLVELLRGRMERPSRR